MAQNDKNSVCHASHLRKHTSYDCLLWYTCVKWLYISRIFFFYFLKMLIFWVAIGVKGQKMSQNEKKFCLLYSISQEPYIIWLLFVVHMFKMIISLVVFFSFSKFWFFRLLGGSKSKKLPNMTKNSVHCTLYLRNHTPYDIYLRYTCVKG